MAFGKKQALPFGKGAKGAKGAPGKPLSKGGKLSKGR